MPEIKVSAPVGAVALALACAPEMATSRTFTGTEFDAVPKGPEKLMEQHVQRCTGPVISRRRVCVDRSVIGRSVDLGAPNPRSQNPSLI